MPGTICWGQCSEQIKVCALTKHTSQKGPEFANETNQHESDKTMHQSE